MMLRCVSFVVVLVITSSFALGQTSFFAVATGNWNGSGIWSTDGVTPITCVTCVAGTHFPGQDDQAFTQGFSLNLPAGASFSVSDLYVAFNVANSITRPGLGANPVLTIRGELAAYDPVLFDYAIPTVAVIRNTGNPILVTFTGENAFGDVINSLGWGPSAPLLSARFNPPSPATLTIGDLSIANNGQLVVLNGTLQLNGALRSAGANGTITVNSGTTLRVALGSISGDGTPTSRFPSIVVNGTLSSDENTTSYINSVSLTANSGANLNIGFNGANQTQGWWYQSNSPSASLNILSTVTYSASTSQTVLAGPLYGSLSLTSSSAATKTLGGSGLTIQGSLNVGANVTTAPASLVRFTGTSSAFITGAGTLTFDGGLEVDKPSGVLTLSKAITINGGATVTNGTFDLGDVTTTLASGSFAVGASGIVTSGNSGTLTVTGTSTFSGSGSLTLHNLTVSAPTTINNSAWSITGSITNNSTLTLPSTSTITFSGSSAQNISGNPITIGNMIVDKGSSSLSINGTVELLRSVTMTNGTLDADGTGSGNFILNSDTNGDARIAAMTGGSITGEVTFERYFANSSNRWRNLAFPVTSVDYSELGASIALGTNSLAIYTESILGDVNQGWSSISGGTLNSTVGYSAWMYNAIDQTISVRGPLLRSTPATGPSPYDFGVTYNDDPGQPASEDGWNFVPNPFASPINWNNSGWTKTRVNAVAAIWDAQNFQYLYSGAGWDGIVASGQSFWVQTNAGSPVLTATESIKTSTVDPTFYQTAQEESALMVSLRDVNNRTDRAKIQFNPEASSGFDSQFDAFKLQNQIFNLSSFSPKGENLAINVMPPTACTQTVKLNVTNIQPGSYRLIFEGQYTFDNLKSVRLLDTFKKQSVKVEEGGAYDFEVTNTPESYGSERFQIVFEMGDIQTPEVETIKGLLKSSFASGNQWFFNGKLIPGATGQFFKPMEEGEYSLQVSSGECQMMTEALPVNTITSRVSPIPADDVITVEVAGVLQEGSGEIVLMNALGGTVKRTGFAAHDIFVDIDVSELSGGVYLLSVNSANGLEKIKVVIR